jgi:four helix bundle protein
MSEIKGFRDLIVYQKAYKLALLIFEISKAFPKEEKYSLTDQIRRSSRSVTANISESWAKKKYLKAFVNKLTDALGEEYETEVWMDFSKDFKYVNQDTYDQIMSGYDEVRKMLIA